MTHRPSSHAARSALAALASLLGLLVPATLHAQARPALELSWSAPAGCPQQERARRLVAEYLGERALQPVAPDARVLRAHAFIRTRAKRWELRLETELDGQPGERTLAAGTCADVAAAAALVLAFAIDPGAALKHSAPAAAAPPAPSPAAPPDPAPSRATVTFLALSASVRYDVAALPGGSVGAALGAMIERGPWAGALHGFVFAERSRSAADRPAVGGEFSMWAIAAAPCWSPAYRHTLRLRMCLPVELQRLHARGYGVDEPAEATRSEILAGVELTPGFGLSSRVELTAPLGLAVALQRPEFYLERIGSVFRASTLQARLGLGLRARF